MTRVFLKIIVVYLIIVLILVIGVGLFALLIGIGPSWLLSPTLLLVWVTLLLLLSKSFYKLKKK